MKNLAIVIGVPEYLDERNNLPACKNDAAAFREMLQSDGRFDDILYMDEKLTSGKVKERIAKFIEEYGGQKINEVLFYFTGHGEFHQSELYFLLSNFEEARRRQTSLSNSEIDQLVRSLNPNLFSKIVDACNSGVSYIKSKDSIELYIKSSQSKFSKVYFLFSSQSDQFSYQNDRISYFTEAVIKSVTESDTSPVRYKDVMSYVADEFEQNGFQTPLFVAQADFTETFVSIPDTAKDALKAFLNTDANKTNEKLPVKQDLIGILKAEASRYCTEEQAREVLNDIERHLQSALALEELEEIYDVSIDLFDSEPPSPSAIGKWLEETNEDIRYFAKPRREHESYQRPKDINNAVLASLSLFANGRKEIEYETAYRWVTRGYENSWASPYQFVLIKLRPKLASVAPEAMYIAPIVSRTKLRIFWALSHYEYTDWDSTRRVNSLDWKTWSEDLTASAAIETNLAFLASKFVHFVRNGLEEKWLQNHQKVEISPPASKGQSKEREQKK